MNNCLKLLNCVVVDTVLDLVKKIINYLNSLLSTRKRTILTSSRTVWNAVMQCMFTDNHTSSFCFWVFEKRLTQENCFLFCKKYGLFNNSIFLTIKKFLLSHFPTFHGQRSEDKILVFLTRCRVVSAGSRSRPGHNVSGTRSKFPNLHENGQKSLFFGGFSDSEPRQHPGVNILSRSAIVSQGEGSFKEPIHKQFYSK